MLPTHVTVVDVGPRDGLQNEAQPVDTHRALHDSRYIKDLLLVCDAMEGTDLPQLATQFRIIDEQTSAARRALAPRPNTRQPMPYVPTGLVPAQRPVTFGRER